MIVNNDVFFDLLSTEIKQGKEVIMAVKGISMLPFLKEDQRIAIQPFSGSALKLGDIALAKWNNKYILHRVIAQNGNVVSLAGDNNLSLIEKIDVTNVLGIVKGYFKDKEEEDVYRNYGQLDRLKGLIWFYIRVPRIIIKKIKHEI